MKTAHPSRGSPGFVGVAQFPGAQPTKYEPTFGAAVTIAVAGYGVPPPRVPGIDERVPVLAVEAAPPLDVPCPARRARAGARRALVRALVGVVGRALVGVLRARLEHARAEARDRAREVGVRVRGVDLADRPAARMPRRRTGRDLRLRRLGEGQRGDEGDHGTRGDHEDARQCSLADVWSREPAWLLRSGVPGALGMYHPRPGRMDDLGKGFTPGLRRSVGSGARGRRRRPAAACREADRGASAARLRARVVGGRALGGQRDRLEGRARLGGALRDAPRGGARDRLRADPDGGGRDRPAGLAARPLLARAGVPGRVRDPRARVRAALLLRRDRAARHRDRARDPVPRAGLRRALGAVRRQGAGAPPPLGRDRPRAPRPRARRRPRRRDDARRRRRGRLPRHRGRATPRTC